LPPHPDRLSVKCGVGHNESTCGRYVESKATGDLLSQFEAKEIEGSPPPPSWNVAPIQDVPIIAERLDEGSVDRRLLIARWGLVPSWAKDIKIGSKLINARSESILDKPSFRKAAVKRRALIPAEGNYEWQKTEDETVAALAAILLPKAQISGPTKDNRPPATFSRRRRPNALVQRPPLDGHNRMKREDMHTLLLPQTTRPDLSRRLQGIRHGPAGLVHYTVKPFVLNHQALG
jgi:hypothetical protein